MQLWFATSQIPTAGRCTLVRSHRTILPNGHLDVDVRSSQCAKPKARVIFICCCCCSFGVSLAIVRADALIVFLFFGLCSLVFWRKRPRHACEGLCVCVCVDVILLFLVVQAGWQMANVLYTNGQFLRYADPCSTAGEGEVFIVDCTDIAL